MLRDKSLVLLSHQHQHALALCVRIDRGAPIRDADLAEWLAEVSQLFQTEIGMHFAAEEQVVFPAVRKFEELVSLADDLQAEHAVLREKFAQAESGGMSANDLSALGRQLAAHIRKEERQLFERLQELMSPAEMELLGRDLNDALKDAVQACPLATETTKLRPAKGATTRRTEAG